MGRVTKADTGVKDRSTPHSTARSLNPHHSLSIVIAKLASEKKIGSMSTTPVLRVAVFLALFSAVNAARAESPDISEAKGVATAWLAKLDADDFSECWNLLASDSKSRVSRWRWNLGCKMGRFSLGKAIARKLKSAERGTKTPGGRSGEFVIVKFETQSEKKGAVFELVAVQKDHDNQVRVGGYGVETPDN